MSRITTKFSALKRAGRKGFIPFVTAGDPDIETSTAVVLALAELGADVIEIGVPFSDPMADGPTIQASSQRALENGADLPQVLSMTAKIRNETDVPIILFSYFNPLFRYGLEKLAIDARIAGVDGILVTDVVDGEADKLRSILDPKEIDLISLVAPTTSDTRLESICTKARGFLYAVSRAGVTGASSNISDSAKALAKRARQFTDMPLAVGFGISKREHIEDVWQFADAAVVGSAIVSTIKGSSSKEEALFRLRSFIDGLLPRFAKQPTEI